MELTGEFRVVEVKKKTKAVLFRDLKEGDSIILKYPINGSYGYAPSIEILAVGQTHYNNATQLNSNLSHFKIEKDLGGWE